MAAAPSSCGVGVARGEVTIYGHEEALAVMLVDVERRLGGQMVKGEDGGFYLHMSYDVFFSAGFPRYPAAVLLYTRKKAPNPLST